MRAFITGASGFIGTHLVSYLLKEHWEIKILQHKTPFPSLKNRVKVIQGDVRDYHLLEKSLSRGDIVFNLASVLGASLKTEKEFFEINALGTKNVLQAALEKGVNKFIHFSSAGVLGSVKKREIADEDYPLNPEDIYEKSKFEGEKIALEFVRKGVNIIIIRPGWVYGPGDKRTFKLIKAIAKGRFFLIGKGETNQTPIYINDLIRGIYLCTQKGVPGEIYHLAGLEVLTVKEMAEIISKEVGRKLPFFRLPLFPTEIFAWGMDKVFKIFKAEAPLTPSKVSFFVKAKPLSVKKAQQELGFYPKMSFTQGIKKSIAWYREQGWL
ncbi:MAG: NAD-dependent epimerase/dehydratase family protein [Candidatus Aminicenantia bacterium]